MTRLRLLEAALVACLTPATFAQGGDTCAQAEVIAGTGLFPYDNSAATTDSASGCAMARDVWFRWTAPTTRPVTVSTCGWSTTPGLDPALAVYAATACPPAAPIACEDDVCGLEAEIAFAATAGQEYLFRVGTWASASFGGEGFLEVSIGGVVGGCPSPSRGPNVVAGDLDAVIAYGSQAGTSAYSFATTACNVGDEEIDWVAQSTRHPVVAHSLFRYENGRFEQLGTGWAKHGIGALQRELCCPCEPSASISALGVGCSDPYSASLNGTQITLGPRSEVDGFRGSIAWPIGSVVGVTPPATILDRRVQVPTGAVDPALHPGAVYLAEAVYGAEDDAARGNGFDNASHRPYRRTGALFQGAHGLEPLGVTERGRPAIDAWARLSTTALVREVRVPGEGAFWVGSDAVPLGGGAWRYELCVYNLNSDRGAAGLEVFGGAAARDLGMSFPRAHSGEPRRNDPWPGVVASGDVSWSAPQAAVDPAANAILWGTGYSFWFTCDSPPVDGVGELVMFRGPGPGRLPVPLRLPRAPGAPAAALVCEAEPNSTGVPGLLLPGAHDPSGGTLDLRAIGLPPQSIGMVIVSRDPGLVPMAGGSSGTLCLGGLIGRSVGAATAVTSLAGELSVMAHLGALPQGPGSVAVQPGDTWIFQAWHRDVPATSNFTQAVSLGF